jgi:hypothetical protein
VRAILVLALVACGSRTEARIAKAVARGPGAVVNLDTLAPGRWTRLFVLNPYTPPEEVDSLLGFHWDEAQQEGLQMRDDINLLVFVDGAKVTDRIAFRRGQGDFCCFERNASYARASARFVVVQDGLSTGGAPWLRLRHIDTPLSTDR